MPVEVDVAIIGAGVVGLAIAAELSRRQKGTIVLEKNHTFGLETSSRNSEVIHAGIYYPEGSLKARLCVEANRLLYDFCQKYDIPHRRQGKIIVATDEDEVSKLEELYQQGLRNGVGDLRLLSHKEVKELEPNVEANAGMMSPSTGIIDGHSLMRVFHGLAREQGVNFIFNTEVIGIEKTEGKYRVEIQDREGTSSFTTNVLINSAGLSSDKIASLVGIDIDQAGYKLHYCKGEYFSLNSPHGAPVSRLVYPLPELGGKGIHVTLNLDDQVRLGPNVRYVDELDYKVDETQKEAFYQSVKKFLPRLRLEDLEPDFAGIRPKLQGPEEDFRDFIITEETARGLPGLINLIGIESPGLTASPVIARYVARIASELR
ncbi:MAG: NAD(P)/FAD-dependent oxidoreductase [Dehalococcoidales bacterium]|nr:MAG: NAD(P)/FAD-dependent oxidoreductase [Dehalococcoidales bacterium]